MSEHGRESLKIFLEKINSIHPTIKFTAHCSVNFPEGIVILKDEKIVADYMIDLQTLINNELEYWLKVLRVKSIKDI